jgi:hypothetical protein
MAAAYLHEGCPGEGSQRLALADTVFGRVEYELLAKVGVALGEFEEVVLVEGVQWEYSV